MSLNRCPRLRAFETRRSDNSGLPMAALIALLVGALLLVRSVPGTTSEDAAPATAVPPAIAEPAALDADVDWGRVEAARDEPGLSVAAYER